MAEDNQDQARAMAREGQAKMRDGKDGYVEGRGLAEQAKRLDRAAISDVEMETEEERDPGLASDEERQVDSGSVKADVRGRPPTV